MGICPRCGSWVDEGDVCRSCGGVREVTSSESGGNVSSNPPVDLWAIRWSADEKINSAMFEARGNYNYGRAMRLVNSAINEIGNYGELSDLKDLAFGLRAEIQEYIRDEDANKHYEEILKKKDRNKLVNMRSYYYNFNPNDLVFKLVKDDDGFISVYYEDIKVGYISETYEREKYYSSVTELKNLPKISYAKYFCRYPGKFNYRDNNGGSVLIELLDSPVKFDANTKKRIKQIIDEELLLKRETEARKRVKQLNILNQHSKKELITIAGTYFHKAVKLEKGTRLKLVKEPDNSYDKDAIAVYVGDDKVGYVANSEKTAFSKTSRASDLKYLPDVSDAEYLMYYGDSWHMARLKKS